jgi:hypothetical protein
MLEPMLPAVLDLLVHGCVILSVSSFLIMLALQPLLPGGNVATAASRGVCSASRAVLVRLLSGRSDGDGVAVAPPPPPRRSRSRHRCERCASSSWPDVVAAVTASLRLDDDDDDMECSNSSSSDENEEEDTAAACGGCAAMAAVEDLLERKEATEQELREAFYVFDRDDDGFVGAGELWNVLRRLGMQLPDGAAAREDCCARMIAAHDGDGDGRISFPEFRAMMEHAA